MQFARVVWVSLDESEHVEVEVGVYDDESDEIYVSVVTVLRETGDVVRAKTCGVKGHVDLEERVQEDVAKAVKLAQVNYAQRVEQRKLLNEGVDWLQGLEFEEDDG